MSSITPHQIRKAIDQFSRSFLGYRPEDVETYLRAVADDVANLREEQRSTKSSVEELKAKLNHYERVEEALQEALRTARENAVKTQEHAEEKAALILEEAEKKAERIVEEARVRADRIAQEADQDREEARVEAREILADAKREHTSLRQEIAQLVDRRDQILARLRSFLLSEMEILAKSEGADPIGYLKLLPAQTTSTDLQSGPFLETGSPEESEPAVDVPEANGGASEQDEQPVSEAASATPGPEQEEPKSSRSKRKRKSKNWTVHEVVAPPEESEAEEEDATVQVVDEQEELEAPVAEGDEDEATDEMKKIHRILKELS